MHHPGSMASTASAPEVPVHAPDQSPKGPVAACSAPSRRKFALLRQQLLMQTMVGPVPAGLSFLTLKGIQQALHCASITLGHVPPGPEENAISQSPCLEAGSRDSAWTRHMSRCYVNHF